MPRVRPEGDCAVGPDIFRRIQRDGTGSDEVGAARAGGERGDVCAGSGRSEWRAAAYCGARVAAGYRDHVRYFCADVRAVRNALPSCGGPRSAFPVPAAAGSVRASAGNRRVRNGWRGAVKSLLREPLGYGADGAFIRRFVYRARPVGGVPCDRGRVGS